jgi:uncharacterized protein (DUF488 family)
MVVGMTQIFSLGHSNLALERFVELLSGAGVTAVADVRTSPYSKYTPWFSQQELRVGLRENGLAYAFLGEELGGRPRSSDLYRGGVADYVAMSGTEAFRSGLGRLVEGARRHRIAMVCSERDPLHCHRCLLVARQLTVSGVDTRHIHSDGHIESQQQAEERLLEEEGLSADDLLWPRPDRMAEAYLRRSRDVAYAVDPEKSVQFP